MSERFGYRVKTAPTVRTSLAAATVDPDLSFPIVAGKTYIVRFGIMLSAAASCDFKYSFRCLNANITRGGVHVSTENPVTTTAGGWSYSDNEAGTFGLAQLQSGTTTKAISGLGTVDTYLGYHTYLFGAATFTASASGTFEFLWSQSTAHATDPAAVLAGSFLFFEIMDDAPYSWAQKSVDETRYSVANTTPYADDSDLQITLEPDQRYIVEYIPIVFAAYTYGGRLHQKLVFDGDVEEYVESMVAAPVWYTSGYNTNSAADVLRTTPPQLGGAYSFFNSTGTSSTATRGSLYSRIFLKTGEAGGTLKVQWCAGGIIDNRAATLFAGSLLYAAKLNQCMFGIAAPTPTDYCENFEVGEWTWAKPAGVTWVEVTLLGGGGGGGSGAVGNVQIVLGGQGGGGGERRRLVFKASDLGATETIVVGAGGAGAASISATTPNNDGLAGSNGGASSFGSHATAAGGSGGAKGAAGSVGTAYDNGGGSATTPYYKSGAWYSATRGRAGGKFSQPSGTVSDPYREGGAGGGGQSRVGQTPFEDGSAGHDSPDGTISGGSGGVSDPTNSAPGAGGSPADHASDAGAGGGGGGGGGYWPQAPGAYGGAGGDGGDFGAGGGGGGGAVSFGTPASTSGAGGDGSRGLVRVCYYFGWKFDYSTTAATGYDYDDSTTYRVLRVAGSQPALSPARPVGHPQYDNVEFWQAAYNAAVAAGDMPAGLFYGQDYPATQAFGYRKAW